MKIGSMKQPYVYIRDRETEAVKWQWQSAKTIEFDNRDVYFSATDYDIQKLES